MAEQNKTKPKKEILSTKKIYRSEKNCPLGGVAGGLGEYFNLDPVIIRILFVLLGLSGGGVIFYLILWLIIPRQEDVCLDDQQVTKNNATEIKQETDKYAQAAKKKTSKKGGQIYLAIALVILGLYLCLANYGFLGRPGYFFRPWPLTLVIFGLILFLNHEPKND
jgi:phage shock protein PspC (stress-responsive transcriptional regulator)